MKLPLMLMTTLGLLLNSASSRAADPTNTAHHTYVLVHGAWGNGADWRRVGDLLTADGNRVYRATLTGQGERVHLASTNVDLSTHITDVANLILWENLHDVVLVGHSYGGMVVTGVADRVPDRLQRVVYLDAMLPVNGESVRDLFKVPRPGMETNGWIYPTWVKPGTPPPHDVPMSAKAFNERLTLTNQARVQSLSASYILTVDSGALPQQDLFYASYQRATQRGWPAWTMVGDHNVHWSRTEALVRELEKAAAGSR